jgi:hypothetical protein
LRFPEDVSLDSKIKDNLSYDTIDAMNETLTHHFYHRSQFDRHFKNQLLKLGEKLSADTVKRVANR